MKLKTALSRFLVPGCFVTLYYFLKYRCIISPKSEVELSDNLVIGKASQISSYTKIKATAGPLTIGSRVDVATGCFIASGEKALSIGDDCLIGPNCSIIASEYISTDIGTTFREQGYSSKGTVIGNNVMVGAGTVILDGSRIGDGVIIAANSLVSGKVAANSVVQGSPAKVIFNRR